MLMQHYLLCRKRDVPFAPCHQMFHLNLALIGLYKYTVCPHSQSRSALSFGQNYVGKQTGIHQPRLVITGKWFCYFPSSHPLLSLWLQTFIISGFCSLFQQVYFPLRSNEWQCYMTEIQISKIHQYTTDKPLFRHIYY